MQCTNEPQKAVIFVTPLRVQNVLAAAPFSS
ncbi:hypothetical protein THICB3110217 [Thiomonas sp. CB3]|nr:hypothetical protein THICB3110217 [Thiomonas sp. CB3]